MKWSIAIPSFIVAGVCVYFFQNCSRHSFDASSTVEFPTEEIVVQSNSDKPVKVIFLVDDSFTMAPMQNILAKGIKSVAEKRLRGTAVSAMVFATSTRPVVVSSDSLKVIKRELPRLVGSIDSKSFSQTEIVRLETLVKSAGIYGSAAENIRHRLAALLADDRADSSIQKGDRIAFVLVSDEDDPSDSNVSFETTYSKIKKIQTKSKSTHISFTYSIPVEDGPGSVGTRSVNNSIDVEPGRFLCEGSTNEQQLAVVRAYYKFNSSISQAASLQVTSCIDRYPSTANSFEEIAASLVDIDPSSNFQAAPKFDFGNQEFGCAMTNFKVRFSKTEYKDFATVLDYIDEEFSRIKQNALTPTDFGYYTLSSRSGGCVEEFQDGNGVGSSLALKMLALTGTSDVDQFIAKRLMQLTGGAFFVSSIVSTDASKLQGSQSVGNRIIQLTKSLSGNVLSIHDGDYSDALQPVADFVLHEVGLRYPLDPSTLSMLRGVRLFRAGQEIVLNPDADYKIETSAIVFTSGVVHSGDRVLLNLYGAK